MRTEQRRLIYTLKKERYLSACVLAIVVYFHAFFHSDERERECGRERCCSERRLIKIDAGLKKAKSNYYTHKMVYGGWGSQWLRHSNSEEYS